MAAWSRDQVAGYSGNDWLEFLNRTGKSSLFSESQIDTLRDSAYSSRIREGISTQDLNDLINVAAIWIRCHHGNGRRFGGRGDIPMISFEYFWIFWLAPLPLASALLFPGFMTGEASVRIPRLWRVAELTGRKPSSGAVVRRRKLLTMVVLVVAWIACLTALARPQWIGEPITRNLPARDMLLAVDLSGSMSTEDFTDADGKQVNRLDACKQVLDEFLTRRQGDRVGLVFFGTAAFVQAPFTEDLELCRTFLDEAQVGMAGPQTVIGDAVGLSLSVFERSEQEDRVLILLTMAMIPGARSLPMTPPKLPGTKELPSTPSRLAIQQQSVRKKSMRRS